MKSFIVLATLLTCGSANPGFAPGYSYATAPQVYNYNSGLGYGYSTLTQPVQSAYSSPAAAAPVYTNTRYHAQDELGQVSHGYAHPGQARAETRDAAGNVRGSYAYIDPTGKEVRVNYVADSLGFRADSNALPVAPASTLVGPSSVQYTPEVARARADHFAAFQQIAAGRSGRNSIAPNFPYAAQHFPPSYASLPAYRTATLTNVHNNPGHALSYRVY